MTEWGFWEVSIPARGTPHKLRGEALYLDLGPGKKPLIALLTSHLHAKPGGTIWDWPGDDLLSRLYGPHGRDDFLGGISRLAGMRGPRSIGPADLPHLVSFADVNDPKTVLEVDPNDLQATIGHLPPHVPARGLRAARAHRRSRQRRSMPPAPRVCFPICRKARTVASGNAGKTRSACCCTSIR